jgi:hypothetical protein
MNWKKSIRGAYAVAMIGLLVVSGCRHDSADFSVSGIMADSIDLDGNKPATSVPVKPVITVTFNFDVSVPSAISENVRLIQDYNDLPIGISVTATGNTMSIIPADGLGSGTLYALTLTSEIKSAEGLSLKEITVKFTTVGSFSPGGTVAYWNFEGNADDVLGTYDPPARGVIDISYSDSRNSAAGKAADFNGTTSIIEIPDADLLMNSTDFTICFWVRTNSTGHLDAEGKPAGYFVMGLGAYFGFEFEMAGDFSNCRMSASYSTSSGVSIYEDLQFSGDGKSRDNGGWQGWTFCRDLTSKGGVPDLLQDKWANIAFTYAGSTKIGTLYINGEKMKSQDFNLWFAGDARQRITGLRYSGTAPTTVNELAFGFIKSRAGTLFDADPVRNYFLPTSNHFKGQLDDVRIFHKALMDSEILLMFNSEK